MRVRWIDAVEAYELRFESLFATRIGFFFPCDATGAVDMNALSERARCNYLFARVLVGREFAVPAIEPQWH